MHLLGGPAALSEAVAQQVAGLGVTTTRHSGPNRFATAVAVAEVLDADVVMLATGHEFVPPLLAGAAAPAQGAAVLLTAGPVIPPETQAHLDAHPGRPRIAIGPDAVASDVDATRVDGAEPAELSVAVALGMYPHDLDVVAVASAEAFPDSLTGGPHAPVRGAPLLLSPPGQLADLVTAHLQKRTDIDRAFLYGGTAAVTEAVAEELRGLLTR